MALAELRIYSEELGKQTSVNVILPQQSLSGEIGIDGGGINGKYKTLYLLHGLSDDYSIWLRRTSIERYAQERGIAVVMPDGARSFYTDMVYGGKYYSYIAKELPKIMRSFFPMSDKREDNYIAGLSMGGYGALKIGLRECDSFSAIAGMSSVADIAERADIFYDDYKNIFGDSVEIPNEENLMYLAEENDKNPNKPRVFMGVGTEDFLYDDNQKLRKIFESLSYDYTYRESEGIHCWQFWDEYIQYILDWMLKSE